MKMNKIEILTTVMGLSMLVLGSLGLAGKLINPAFGWIAVGLGSGTLLLSVVSLRLENNNWAKLHAFKILPASVVVALGILGTLNIVNTNAIGGTLIGACPIMMTITRFILRNEQDQRLLDDHLESLHTPLNPNSSALQDL